MQLRVIRLDMSRGTIEKDRGEREMKSLSRRVYLTKILATYLKSTCLPPKDIFFFSKYQLLSPRI
jgi:hypothetical protein